MHLTPPIAALLAASGCSRRGAALDHPRIGQGGETWSGTQGSAEWRIPAAAPAPCSAVWCGVVCECVFIGFVFKIDNIKLNVWREGLREEKECDQNTLYEKI